MIFMVGLALGSGTLSRPAAVPYLTTRGSGILLALLLMALCFLQVFGLRSGAGGHPASIAVLLLAVGFLVSALFAWASLQGAPEQRPMTGPLYAADLLGGSAGALLASIVLVPLLGLEGATLVAALAAATTLLAV
jgi:hypothetical protein